MLLSPAYHGNGAVWYSLHYPIDASLTTLDHENRNRHHICHFAWLKKQNHVCHRRQQRIDKPSSKTLRHSLRLDSYQNASRYFASLRYLTHPIDKNSHTRQCARRAQLKVALAQLGGSKHAVTQPEVCFVDWPSTSLFDHLGLSPDTTLKKRLPAIIRTYADCHASTSCPYIVKRHQTVENCRKNLPNRLSDKSQ